MSLSPTNNNIAVGPVNLFMFLKKMGHENGPWASTEQQFDSVCSYFGSSFHSCCGIVAVTGQICMFVRQTLTFATQFLNACSISAKLCLAKLCLASLAKLK